MLIGLSPFACTVTMQVYLEAFKRRILIWMHWVYVWEVAFKGKHVE